jgi:hypothetical protein
MSIGDLQPVAGCYFDTRRSGMPKDLGCKEANHREPKMKSKLLISTVAVLLLASIPVANANANAKYTHKRVQARAPTTSVDSPEVRYRNDPYAVWVAGTYVGRDPDPRVRDSLIREFYHNLDNR